MTATTSNDGPSVDITDDIHVERIPICRPDLPDLADFTELLGGIWESQMLSNFGPISQQLEAEAAEYLGVEHVRATASGDIAMMSILKALDLEPGSPCFLSPFTFNSTINTALWNQLTPVFVDIDYSTYNMSPRALAAAISEHDGNGVVLATHVFGNPCEIEALDELASDAGHRLVFDAAHGLGSVHDGVRIGNFGDAEMFSLSGTKPVTSGEGGLVATRHEWLMERIERIRGYGFRGNYRSDIVGLNGKMSEIHAALGLLNVRRVDEILDTRRVHLERYHDQLATSVTWQRVREGDESTTKDLVINVGTHRRMVEDALAQAGIQTKRYFVPLHFMPAYRTNNEHLPAAEAAFEHSLCIPFFGSMTAAQVDRVCSVISSARRG